MNMLIEYRAQVSWRMKWNRKRKMKWKLASFRARVLNIIKYGICSGFYITILLLGVFGSTICNCGKPSTRLHADC